MLGEAERLRYSAARLSFSAGGRCTAKQTRRRSPCNTDVGGAVCRPYFRLRKSGWLWQALRAAPPGAKASGIEARQGRDKPQARARCIARKPGPQRGDVHGVGVSEQLRRAASGADRRCQPKNSQCMRSGGVAATAGKHQLRVTRDAGLACTS